MRISIEGKLLRVLIQLLKVMLSLGHKAKNFKLTRQGSFHFLQPKLLLRNRHAHVFQMRVLNSPLQGDVLVTHDNILFQNYKVISNQDQLGIIFISLIFDNQRPEQIFSLNNCMIPPSFDQLILSDQLFKVMKNSPQTKHLVSLRAQQIIKQLMQRPIQVRLNKQIQACRTIIKEQQLSIQNLQEELKSIKNKNERSQKKIKKNMASKLSQNQNMFLKLEEQLNQRDNQVSELNQYKEQLQKQLQNYSIQLQKNGQEILSLREQMSIFAKQKETLHKEMQSEKNQKNALNQMIEKLKSEVQQKQNDIQSLNILMQNVKKQHRAELKQSKRLQEQTAKTKNQQILRLKQARQKSKLKLIQNQTDYQILKKQIDAFKTKYGQFSQQHKNIKQSSARQISNLHTQINHLNKCLSQSSKLNKLQQAKLKKFQKLFFKVKQLQSQIKVDRTLFQQQIKLLKGQCETTISQITDKIGSMINIDLQAYLQKLIRYKEEIIIYRQQKKIKDQIIQKLQRMLQSQTNGSIDLKNELRMKKKQEQKLKKQLKRNYQQNDFKLESIQKKYIQLLQDTTNYP